MSPGTLGNPDSGGRHERHFAVGDDDGSLLVLATAGASGQTRVVLGLGGGVIFPTKGSFGSDVKSMGYHFQAMVGVAPGAGKVTFRLDGQYAGVNYEAGTSSVKPKDQIITVNADLVLHPTRAGSVRPYIMGGPTYGSFKYKSGVAGGANETTNNAGFNAGAGLNIGGTGKVWFFLESRFIYTKDHKYIPVTVGIRINTGG